MHVAVIGAGVVGASVARELALQGASVTIFEQQRPGSGTTGTTFAWVNSHEKRPDSYHRLNVAACHEHRRLAEDSNTSPQWFYPTGNLEWADDPSSQQTLHDRVLRLQQLDYACRWLDPAAVAGLEPDVRLPGNVTSVAFFPDEGYVLPAMLLARLLGEARDRGAVLRCPARVTALQPTATGVDVRLEGGERERFDRVVSCVGRWTERLSATVGAAIPLADPDEPGGAAVGLLAYTTPAPLRLSRLLTSPRLNVRPDGGGRLVLQGLDLDSQADPASPPKSASDIGAELINRLEEVLTMGGLATIDSIRVGQRALPADGLTVAGFTDDDRRCYAAATHSGITLGPLLGRLIAAEVLDKERSPMLSDFRPGRFSTFGNTVTAAPARKLGEQ